MPFSFAADASLADSAGQAVADESDEATRRDVAAVDIFAPLSLDDDLKVSIRRSSRDGRRQRFAFDVFDHDARLATHEFFREFPPFLARDFAEPRRAFFLDLGRNLIVHLRRDRSRTRAESKDVNS